MGCIHCLDDCKDSNNSFMSIDTFKRSLDFINKNNFMVILISGGEPLEHPQFFEIAELAIKSKLKIVILSNGMWIENEDIRKKVLDLGIPFQITNDVMYYPKRIKKIEHKLLVYEEKIRVMSALGRAKENKIIGTRKAPFCFNLRSATNFLKNFKHGVMTIRNNGKICTPYIEIDGSILAGESKYCYKIGTIDSTNEELTKNLLDMKCNYCKLENNLSEDAKKAIRI